MSARRRRSQAGLSLVEMLIAMVLGLVVTGAVVGVFIAGSRSYAQDEHLSSMQDELRFAIGTMTTDLEMAGFWGVVLNPDSIGLGSDLVLGTDCGPAAVTNWTFDEDGDLANGETALTAVQGVDNTDGASANDAFSCIDADEVAPNTDVIAIKRVAGTAVRTAPNTTVTMLQPGTIYLRANSAAGLIFDGVAPVAGEAGDVPVAGSDDWVFRPSIYYIRRYSVVEADGIPTLCRKAFQGTGFVTECLAEGVEDLQVEYGVDPDFDGVPDQFQTADEVAAGAGFGRVVSVRLWLLGRSASADINYTNEKTYQLSNAPARTASDGYYRKSISTVVLTRNPAALARVFRR